MTYRLASIIPDTLQESILQQIPWFPDRSNTDNMETPLSCGQAGTHHRWQSSDVSPQHPACLLKQPDTQLVTWHSRLRDTPGQGCKVCFAETVIAVTQQSKPDNEQDLKKKSIQAVVTNLSLILKWLKISSCTTWISAGASLKLSTWSKYTWK